MYFSRKRNLGYLAFTFELDLDNVKEAIMPNI